MDYKIGLYTESYLDDIYDIWNEAIDDGLTLHWTEHIPQSKVEYIISTQIECICAVSNYKCIGFYILHPNSSGRCSHIANALYIVKKEFRDKGIGSALVKNSLEKAKEHGFIAMQYNSVVASNKSVNIYIKSGFQKVGLIPNGFKLNENQYEDLLILYKKL
jgi:L-amino acid N-acyltransferase YncA